MSLDTKYRPQRFQDVIGQKGTIQVLRNLVRSGAVFSKSYVFAGPSGTGKTTTARILARAMLCENVSEEQEPCNQCESCLEIINGTSSFNFVEMDAANNSGVQTIRNVVESADYYTLGGKDRRIYLIDEAHRLTKEAMDALLKPMEDNLPGSRDKRLVCLFCTTEPEKLRDTIKARCMTFRIKEPSRPDVVERLRYIADQEGLTYEEEALDMIFASGRGHIRDMVNALERISRVGEISAENARSQLGLDAQANYLKILSSLGEDLQEALKIARDTVQMAGAPTVYKGLAEACLTAYRTSMGLDDGIPLADVGLAKEVYTKRGETLLQASDRILRTYRSVDETFLVCELVLMHRLFSEGTFFPERTVSDPKATPQRSSPKAEAVEKVEEKKKPVRPGDPSESPNLKFAADPSYTDAYGSSGVNFVNPNKRKDSTMSVDEQQPDPLVHKKVEDLRPPSAKELQNIWRSLDEA